jgi:hypothetical protein
MDLHDNTVIAELARQQSIETSAKVYAVDAAGRDAVYMNGHMLRWAYIDDIEILYSDEDAAKWERILYSTRH